MKNYTEVPNRNNSVLFITSQLRPREIKLSYALRSMGWRVNLIYSNSTPFQPKRAFDDVWLVSSAKHAYKLAKKLKPKLVHVFSGAIDDYVLLFCRQKVAPVIIDLNDVFAPALMNYCTERYLPTKEALALADGFCARDLQVKYAEKIDRYKIPQKILFFPEYCWNEEQLCDQKKDNNEIHIVSIGTMCLETQGMFDCCYLELVKLILNHKIHFHIYPAWSYRKDYVKDRGEAFNRDFAQFIELERQNSYLHLHNSLPIDQLAKELRYYDFGIISGGCPEFGQRFGYYNPQYIASCYSGRISDYLDAHLPIIINEEVSFNNWILKHYKISVDLKAVLQPQFKEKLQQLKKQIEIKKYISKARSDFSIAENAPRLTKFYSNIISTSSHNPSSSYFSIFQKWKLKKLYAEDQCL